MVRPRGKISLNVTVSHACAGRHFPSFQIQIQIQIRWNNLRFRKQDSMLLKAVLQDRYPERSLNPLTDLE
ncbi:hypothetical protein PG996_008653 [Apiospora saccharicola]|uniref:Uncharacterized protein n=1 Tax=Apiospora saccharicola TaxID=335842 RepID=A0ABR1UYJ1_9PEZI